MAIELPRCQKNMKARNNTRIIAMLPKLLRPAALLTIISLAGCGYSQGHRALTGAAIGAGGGAIIGAATGIGPGTGALIGGGVGAATGASTTHNQLNLGN
jgi:hypothetical protein